MHYIDWFNHRRLSGEIGLVPPAEAEDHYYRHDTAPVPSARQFSAVIQSGASQDALHDWQ